MLRGDGCSSGTVTFLFTDIEGSTRLWQADETTMRSALSATTSCCQAIAATRGQDVFCHGRRIPRRLRVCFGGGDAAMAAQRSLAAEGWPMATRVRVRMGLHTGEAE